MSEPQTAAEILAGYKAARARILQAGLAHERITNPKQLPKKFSTPMTPKLIIETAAEVMGISTAYMMDYTNHNPPFIARSLAAYFMRERLGMPNKDIGFLLGDRACQSISYAITNVRRNIGRYRQWMEAIAKRLP